MDGDFLWPPFPTSFLLSLSLSLFAKSFIIVIYLQLKMPNIYLILSILQFICLPNRSSNKNLPSLPFLPLPGWVTFGRAYRLRLVGKIFNFLPELSDWKRERGAREREKKGNQNQTNLPGEFKTKVCSLPAAMLTPVGSWSCCWSWGWNCWRGFSSRLRSAQKYGSVLSMAVTMATSNAPAYWLPGWLPANEARLASLPLLPLLFSPFPTPRRGFYLKTILFALWICGA